MEKNNENLIAIYQTENGSLNIKLDNNGQTIWASQKEISQLFCINNKTVSDHINNIFKTNEIDKKSTIRNFRILQKEVKRTVQREIEYYNLDILLSVGYRVNSKNAIKFCQ